MGAAVGAVAHCPRGTGPQPAAAPTRTPVVAGLGQTRAGTAERFQPGAVALPPSTRPAEWTPLTHRPGPAAVVVRPGRYGDQWLDSGVIPMVYPLHLTA